MKLKNISGRSRFMGTNPKSVNKEIRLANEQRLKEEAEQNGTLKKYIKANNSPIENTPVIPKTDTEDLPNTGLVSKTPYRDIATYKEEWYTHPIDK